MAYTITPPAGPIVKGADKHETHILSAGGGAETNTGTISAKFLRRISNRSTVNDMTVISKTINNTVFPPTFSAQIVAGPTEGNVELIGD